MNDENNLYIYMNRVKTVDMKITSHILLGVKDFFQQRYILCLNIEMMR